MNEKQILQEMSFSEELIDYIQKTNKLESFEDVPAVIEVEIEEDNVISTSSYYYSSSRGIIEQLITR